LIRRKGGGSIFSYNSIPQRDERGLRGDTIVIFRDDNGCYTSSHAPGNRGSSGPWRSGYFSTCEGNNRTAGMIHSWIMDCA
jgi:arylsulfatase